jgi:hypothetical protein
MAPQSPGLNTSLSLSSLLFGTMPPLRYALTRAFQSWLRKIDTCCILGRYHLVVWSTVSTTNNASSTRLLHVRHVVVVPSPFRVWTFSLASLNGGAVENKGKRHNTTLTHLLTGFCRWVVSAETLQVDRRGIVYLENQSRLWSRG